MYEVTEETIAQLWQKIKETFATKEDAGAIYGSGSKGLYQAIGYTKVSTSAALAAGVITKVPIGSDDDISIGTCCEYVEPYRAVRILETGTYRINGSVYLRSPSATRHIGVYVYMRNDGGEAEWNVEKMTEIVSTYLPKPDSFANNGAIGTTSKVAQLTEGDVLYLAARCSDADGSVDLDNSATFLLIEKIN